MRLKLKKLLPVIITFTFLCSLNMIPANAVTDDDYYCGNYPLGSFTVVSNVVTANNGLCSGLVNIPSGVTSIGVNAFKDNHNITSVVIPDTVLTIDADAFWNADGITESVNW